MAASMAFTAHGVTETEALIMTHGLEVPNSIGLFGGYPGSCVRQQLSRGSDLIERQRAGQAPTGISELEGELTELGPKPGLTRLRPGDVFETSWQGGGGLGDPLDRDPERVAQDCRIGHYTRRFAEQIFGVILAPDDSADAAATAARRNTLRCQRLADTEPPRVRQSGQVAGDAQPIGGALQFAKYQGRRWFACRCGQPLAPCTGNWRDGASRRTVAPESVGFFIVLHPELELRQSLCPQCGRSLSVDVVEKTGLDIQDIELV